MRGLIVACGALAIIGVCAVSATAAERYVTYPSAPVVVRPARPTVACNLQIRYDDANDDAPGDPALGWHNAGNPNQYQFLGVRFTSPTDQSSQVQSASWTSNFWGVPGLVDVTAIQHGNPTNKVTETVNVTSDGTWEVAFANPICVPPGADYYIMLCPHPGVWGVIADDDTDPNGRAYVSTNVGCVPDFTWPNKDFQLWSCVAPCLTTPALPASWGRIKTLYR